MNHTYARRLFTIAAAYNFLASVPNILAWTPLAGPLHLPAPVDPLYTHLALVLVLTFGWGYWRVSRDPVANRPIIHMGIIGKTAVAAAGYIDFFAGHATTFFVAAITGDAIFALLFFLYLRQSAAQRAVG